MQHEKWSCPKCAEKNYDIGEIRVTGSFWSKIFNIQNKRYSSVTCENCSYTEFYRNKSEKSPSHDQNTRMPGSTPLIL